MLEAELAKRERKIERNWKIIIGSSLAAAITAWIPSVSGWIDAQTEKTRRELLVDTIAKEQVSSEEGYKKIAALINQHSDDIRDLNKLKSCQADVEALKEWQRGVDERLHQKLGIKLPAPQPRKSDPISARPAKKISPTRPETPSDDPKVQELKEDLKGSL